MKRLAGEAWVVGERVPPGLKPAGVRGFMCGLKPAPYKAGIFRQFLKCALVAAVLALAVSASAETGAEAWLRYAPIANPEMYKALPSRIVCVGTTPTDQAAVEELQRGLSSMLGRKFTVQRFLSFDLEKGNDIMIGARSDTQHPGVVDRSSDPIVGEQFRIASKLDGPRTYVTIVAGTPQSEMYAVFHLLAEIAEQKPIPADERQSPSSPVRWVNQWDNMDGSIERGYAGRSIFFDDGHVRADLRRAGDYARLLASVGINGCTVNNVNSDLRTLTPETLKEIARIADAFRPWGVKLSLSVDFSSPKVVGGLATFDPLDPGVVAWWQKKVDEIYALIPDFGGFVVKADSEGRAGPSQYGRTPADAANVLAKALKPHGGIVLYRGFVYNHHLDWTDLKADRARAGYDNFHALDGTFDSNVVIQVKHGPIDFQVREPVSPLFAALQHTPQAIELQVTQEYTGQQRHMVFLVPMWKTALDTDMRAQGRYTPVKEIVEGKSFKQPLGGFVGVANVGLDTNWLHHPMALANLYGFGRLAWNPDLTADQIADEWTRQTFGNDAAVVRTVDALQLGSWHAYEEYTGPLGIGGLTDILGVHYGPGIESAERNGWGQWFRGDDKGIGMDRTVATGTGYIGQYPPDLAAKYESLATCPDELLLFMHHVPYTHVLHSGKTLVQHVYDTHYEGAATVATYAGRWEQLRGKVDTQRFQQVLDLFAYQAGHADVWRDAVDQWFQRISGIDDMQHRVGHDPYRVEAEAMEADGYTVVDAMPWEDASGGKAVVCSRSAACSLTTHVAEPDGRYRIAVQYFDLRTGVSSYDLLLNGKLIAHWKADATLPPAVVEKRLGGHTSTRFAVDGIDLRKGDTLMLRGTPGGDEPVPVDYFEITPISKGVK
jgi:alpha-glucuronidase